MRNVDWILSGASMLSLLACAAEIDPSEAAFADDPAEAQVAVVDQALSGSSVPRSITVADATYNGVTEWAYTRHGLAFGANRRATRGVALTENHGSSSLKYSVQMAVKCGTSPTTMIYQTWTQQTLAPGQSAAPELRCSKGDALYVQASYYSIEYSGGEGSYSIPSENNDLYEFRIEDFYVDGIPTRAFAEGAEVSAEVRANTVRGVFINRSNVSRAAGRGEKQTQEAVSRGARSENH